MQQMFCGIDWAEDHHDVALVDGHGRLLAKRRIADDLVGFSELTALLAEHSGTADFIPVDIGIETDRGLLVAALARAHQDAVCAEDHGGEWAGDRLPAAAARTEW